MLARIAEASPRFKARMAGALSLLGLLTAVFGEFFFRRLEIAGDLIAVASMLAVTLLLYFLFKPVNRGLSLLAASFNLVGLTCGALRWNPRGVDIPWY
jgi:dolichyl-phosphate-mannose--protein O-mannosyl transferase